MFEVDVVNRTIQMSIGDTGAIAFRGMGYNFTEEDEEDPESHEIVRRRDVVLFTLKSQNGAKIIEKVCPLENNRFVVYFHGDDTRLLQAGTYIWDLRCFLNPYYEEIVEEEEVDGETVQKTTYKLKDGDQIYTPYTAMTLTLVATVGSV